MCSNAVRRWAKGACEGRGRRSPIDSHPLSGRGPTKSRVRELFEAQDEIAELDDYFTAWVRAYYDALENRTLPPDHGEDPSGTLTWGLLEDGVGYLHVSGMGGFGEGPLPMRLRRMDAVLDAVMHEFADAPAVVIDLTYNTGGEDGFGATLAARFTHKPRLAYRCVAPKSGLEPFEVWTHPANRPRFEGPVVVLNSDITVSAAETFALRMAALPHATLAGTPTRGSFSDLLERPLPGGFHLTLSNEVYTTPDGRCLGGLGVPPDVPLVVFDPADPWRGHVEAVEQARLLARERAR